MENFKKVVFLDHTPTEAAANIAVNLEPLIREVFNQLLTEKAEEDDRPLTMKEAASWLRIGTTLFSKYVNAGEIPFISHDPENPRAAKLFKKEDLKQWLENNRQEALSNIRKSISYEGKA